MKNDSNTSKIQVSLEEYQKVLDKLDQTHKKLVFYESLVDAIPTPTFAKTDDAKFFIVNKAYEEFFGINREDILGSSVTDIKHLPEKNLHKYQEEDLHAIENASVIHYHTTFDLPRGQVEALYWSTGFSTNTNEKGLVGTIVDISKQKEFEDSLSIALKELKSAKVEIELANEHMKLMLDTMPLATQVWSKDHTLLAINDKTAEILGFETKHEFIEHFYELHPKYQPSGVKSHDLGPQYLAEAFEKGYLRKEWIHKTLQGEEIPLDLTFIRANLHGESVLLVFLNDLHEQTKQLSVPQSMVDYSQTMLDTSPFGTLIWDQNGNLVGCNKVLAKIYGLNEASDFLQKFHTLYPEFQPDGTLSVEKMQREVSNTFREGSTQCFWMGTCANGKELPTEIHGVRTMHSNGEYMVVAYLTDLREREENIRKTRAAEKRTEAILDGIPMGINIFNTDCQVIDCNDRAMKLMDMNSKSDYISNIFNYMPALQPNGQESMSFIKEKFEEANEHGKTNCQLMVCTPSGEELPTEITLMQAHIEDENLYIAYIRDLRETNKMLNDIQLARDAAEKSALAKSEFLANMSHEIRTPMNGILGLLHILSATTLDKVQANYMEKALFSTNELLRIINDILDFSKIEAGKLEMETTSFNMHDVCSELESLFGHAIRDKGLSCHINEGEFATTQILGDPLRLKQVLLNLVSNAIKFTSNGSINLLIESHIKDEQMQCQFKIADTGIGLSKEQIKNLFTAFSQADSSVTRKYGGTGLGLAISKSIVEMMQGNIWVESTPDKGSTFYFTATFELDKETHLVDSNLDISSEKQKKYSGHILLVEDNNINQIIAIELLQSVGYTVEIANNGQEAINRLQENIYDIVLMDIQMPVLDGLSATKIIRKKIKAIDLPIIAMSAHAMTGDKEKSLQVGMQDHITKPISPDILYNTLNHWIKKD